MDNLENNYGGENKGELRKKSGISGLKKWQKIAAVGALAAVVIGGGVAASFAIMNSKEAAVDTTPVSSATFDGVNATELKLTDGKNKISSGGVYHVTGSTSAGWIVIDTSDEVKLILDNVTIETSENQAIRSKQANSVLIELVGENKLTSSIPSSDDTKPAISIAGSLTIDGDGSAEVSSTGKGIKAVYNLVVQDGNIDIAKATEGLEASDITIFAGEISIEASDDGINASSSSKNEAEGTSTSSSNGGMMMRGGIDVDDGSSLTFYGGTVYINAAGDGIDSNGGVKVSGGTIYVDGPTSDGDGALDYNGDMEITGGTIVAVGSSGMALNATSSTQPSVLINLSSSYTGELEFGGIRYTPKKAYSSVMISSADLKVGETYELKIGGDAVQSVTVSDNITGTGGGGMMGGGRMGGGGPNAQGGDGAGAGSGGGSGSGGGGTPPSGMGGRR